MRSIGVGFIFALALLLGACASPPPPPQPIAPAPNNEAALPPLPRSSIAAVVLHRAELGLTDEQVGQMEQRDQQREGENAAVRAEMEKKGQSGPAAPSSTSGAGSGGGAPQGMHGGGMGGGMHGGGMHGGRMGGRSPASGSSGGKEADRAATLDDRLDENDTKAYLEAEGVLTEAQQARAREIASDYREQLYERRANARGKSAQTK
jgi:hypothetical protein